MSNPVEDRCIICNGTRQEHSELTRHVFSLTPGDLRPKPQLTERQPMKEPDAAFQVVGRLIEVLLEKEVITGPEALLCFGITVTTEGEKDGQASGVSDTKSD